MVRGTVLGLVLLASCAPAGPPDTPAAREAIAVCGADAAPAVLLKNVPHWRFRDAFERAAKLAVAPELRAIAGRYGGVDLAEHAALLRGAAERVGVRECRLADELDRVASAGASAEDCDAMFKVLEAIGSVSPEYLDDIIAAGCSEIAGCARACVPGLAQLAGMSPEQRTVVLADGCAEFRARPQPGVAAFARARASAFVDACLPRWGAQAQRVAELRKTTGL